MTISTLTLVIGIFVWFTCLWGFRILAMIVVGKVIGRAVTEVKAKIGGAINGNSDSV